MNQELEDWIHEFNAEALTADGFDDCILGVVERYGIEPVVLYDRDKYIEALMGQGMTHVEAEEWFEFNVIGAWVGDGTPAFATLFRPEKEEEGAS